jgi:predicted MFS family arabinose efflux permease
LDRIGSRITMGFLALTAVAGALAFAIGQTPEHLVLSRILSGIGMSGNLMVMLSLLAVWFPVDRFALLSGMIVAIGTVGNLMAATPLALMSLWIGWRASFFVLAGINAVVVTAFIIVMRDHPLGYTRERQQSGSLTAGLGRLFRMYSYWAISLAGFVRYGYFAAIQSLWAGPFLVYGLGLGEITASYAIFAMGVGYMVGLPLGGSISDSLLRSRKKVVLGSMIIFCLLVLIPPWWNERTSWWPIVLTFFGLGLTAAPGQILYAHMKELLPPSMLAQAMTAVNLFTILGAGVMTHLLGFVIGSKPVSLVGPSAFTGLWYVGAVVLVIVSVMYSLVPDSQALKLKKS